MSRWRAGAWACYLLSGLLGTWESSRAQSCTGPSAEILFNETFGTQHQPVGLSNQTSYTLDVGTCPANGKYTVTASLPVSCYGVWHRVNGDHTPDDVQGKMLIINASNEPGEFYRQRLPGLCSQTTYEFSAWGMNLLRVGSCNGQTVRPNLVIRIETETGRPIQTIDIGPLGEVLDPAWQRMAVSFTAPDANEPVLVKLINKTGSAPGTCGNDLALDDIQLVRCQRCPPSPIIVPDVFTPNGDGQNDRLAVLLRYDIVAATTTVFDRWGNLIFSSHSPAAQWDGTMNGVSCPAGYYTWNVSYQYPDSATATTTYTRTGRVLLMR